MTKIMVTIYIKQGVHDHYPACIIHTWYIYSFRLQGLFDIQPIDD